MVVGQALGNGLLNLIKHLVWEYAKARFGLILIFSTFHSRGTSTLRYQGLSANVLMHRVMLSF